MHGEQAYVSIKAGSDNMNSLASQHQLQSLEHQNQSNSRIGSGLGTGVEIAVEGVTESGIFSRRQPASSVSAYSGDAGDIAGSCGEITGVVAEAGGVVLEGITEAGGAIIEGIVNFVCECIAGICDGL